MNRFDKLRQQHEKSVSDFREKSMAIANEAGRVADVAKNAEEIIDDIDKQFQQVTKLTKTDLAFLFIAVGLQCCRQYLLPNDFKRVTAKEGDEIADKVLNKVIICKNKKEIIDVLTQSVPYDATTRSDHFKDIFGELSTGLSGSTHRYRTLGHDPILGWIFGTANILTDSLTKYNFVETYAVQNMKIDGPYVSRDLLGGQVIPTTIAMLNDFLDIVEQDRKLLYVALLRQAVHYGSDYFTKQGLPVPIIPSVNNDFSKYLTTKCNIDSRSIVRGKAVANLINEIIFMTHSLFCTDKENYDLYQIRSNKIITYSNVIASSSNVLYVAISSSLGNEAALKKLDVGGIIVTIQRLFHDIKFRNSIKKEFLEKEFYKQVMGDMNFNRGITMSTKDYKAGMVAGAKPFEEKFREIQNARISAIQKLACENAKEVGELKDISEEHDYLLNFDWKKEYELSSYPEKSIFLGFLKYCIDLMETNSPSEEQKNLLNSLYKEFKVDPFSVKKIDISKLANNSDIGFQNLLYAYICIYFYLANGNFKFEKKYAKEIFDYFRVSKKDKEEIQEMIKWAKNHVNLAQFFRGEDQDYGSQQTENKGNLCNRITAEEEAPAKNINREVAQIFFKNYRGSKYLCTNSYIVFISELKLCFMDKEDGTKTVLLDDIDNDIFDKGLIASFNDYLILFHDSELFIFDLQSGDFEKNPVNINNILNLKTNGKIVAFTHDYGIKYLDLNTLSLHEVNTDITIESRKNFLFYKDYIVFLGDAKANKDKVGYRFYKYNTKNAEITPLSRCFNMEKKDKGWFTESYNVYQLAAYNDTLFVIISWKFADNLKDSRNGFYCYKCSLKHLNDSKIEPFYISNKYIYDFYKYKEFLIYNNASKNYSLTSHSIITDGKKIIEKKYGYDEKSSFSDRSSNGIERFHKPRKYYHLENWLLLVNGVEEKLKDINYL